MSHYNHKLDPAAMFALTVRGLARDGRRGFVDSDEGQMLELSREFGGFVRQLRESAGDYSKAWLDADGRRMSTAWLQEAEVVSLYDAARRYAVNVPRGFQRLHLAEGAAAGPVAEAALKLATAVSFSNRGMEPTKAAGIVTMSNEMARAVDSEGVAAFMDALRNAVIRASNTLLLQAMTKETVAGSGDPVADLRAALAAAADSTGYVVAAPLGTVRELAMASDGRMGINGGEFIPGVHVAPSAEVTTITVIPASRLVIADLGLAVMPSDAANVTIDDVETNLFQTNKTALLAERQAYIDALAPAVEVEE